MGDHLTDKGKNSKVDDFPDPSIWWINECVKVGDDVVDDVDWSTVPDVEFSKFTQFGSIKNNKVVKEVGNVGKDMTEAMKEVGTEKLQELGVGQNIGLVILDDTPIVARRPRKKAKASDSPYVTNFKSGGTSVQVPIVPPTKPIFLTKHPFEISIESVIDLNLTKKYINFIVRSLRGKEKPVYSEKANKLRKAFDFGVDVIEKNNGSSNLRMEGTPK
ncbi:hypothetical protein RND71_021588 [Anisodus tanguticus]|uniref:Uncharacterized protein n=1 Tax=Anisodus tanguticus TaxID=243964 RepID=A0AAE1RY38_9SOLA|nr:hypothetical protein RND71_021588 [Anisodus tanguticus]